MLERKRARERKRENHGLSSRESMDNEIVVGTVAALKRSTMVELYDAYLLFHGCQKPIIRRAGGFLLAATSLADRRPDVVAVDHSTVQLE